MRTSSRFNMSRGKSPGEISTLYWVMENCLSHFVWQSLYHYHSIGPIGDILTCFQRCESNKKWFLPGVSLLFIDFSWFFKLQKNSREWFPGFIHFFSVTSMITLFLDFSIDVIVLRFSLIFGDDSGFSLFFKSFSSILNNFIRFSFLFCLFVFVSLLN